MPFRGQAHQGQSGAGLSGEELFIEIALEDLRHVFDDGFKRFRERADGRRPYRRLSRHRASKKGLAGSVPSSP